MFLDAFNNLIFIPLYNGLIFFIDIVPYADVGIAVILLTVAVKLVLFPLAHKAARMQLRIRAIAPEMQELKERYKDDRQEQTLKMFELYRKHNIRPFLSLLIILIQIPIILGLYWVFFQGGLPDVQPELVYGFIPLPQAVNMDFLGLIDMGGKSVLLAALAGISQFAHSYLALPEPPKRGENPTLKEDLAHSFHMQMKYVMPVIVMGIAYFISAAIALYWVTNNLFAIVQELIVRFEARREAAKESPENAETATA